MLMIAARESARVFSQGGHFIPKQVRIVKKLEELQHPHYGGGRGGGRGGEKSEGVGGGWGMGKEGGR